MILSNLGAQDFENTLKPEILIYQLLHYSGYEPTGKKKKKGPKKEEVHKTSNTTSKLSA